MVLEGRIEHYENTPMQYTEFLVVTFENFI